MTAVAAVLGVVVLMTLLVAWAAAVGPSGVLTGDGPPTARFTPAQTESFESAAERAEIDDVERTLQRTPGDNGLLRAIALVLEIIVALAAAYVLYRAVGWARQTWDARRRPDPLPVDAEFDVLAAPALLAAELAAEAAARRRLLLAEGSPRNAVVAAWTGFETAADRVGAARRPWETSSEFTLRVLELAAADADAVSRLARLYREARFSEHELTEEHRAAALEALDEIQVSLGVGPSVPPARPSGGAR